MTKYPENMKWRVRLVRTAILTASLRAKQLKQSLQIFCQTELTLS